MKEEVGRDRGKILGQRPRGRGEGTKPQQPRVPANYEADTADKRSESNPRYLHAATRNYCHGALFHALRKVPSERDDQVGEKQRFKRVRDDECDESSTDRLDPSEDFLLSIGAESFIVRTRGSTSHTIVSTLAESGDCRDAANVYSFRNFESASRKTFN